MPEADVTVEYDDLIDNHEKWAAAETDANSDAGVRRQQIGEFAEKFGIQNKALSQVRAGLKIKNEGQRMDWLRSWEHMLPLVRERIFGNQPEMELDSQEGADVVPLDSDTKDEVEPFDGGQAA